MHWAQAETLWHKAWAFPSMQLLYEPLWAIFFWIILRQPICNYSMYQRKQIKSNVLMVCITTLLLWFFWILLLEVYHDAMEITSEKNHDTKRLDLGFIKVATMLMFLQKRKSQMNLQWQRKVTMCFYCLNTLASFYSQMARINCLEEIYLKGPVIQTCKLSLQPLS